MNTPKIADYTTRKSYQQNYAKENREAINARKREWRKTHKGGTYTCLDCGHRGWRARINASCPMCGKKATMSNTV